jgi:tetratricopeptide (TPR) repeat protein
MNRPGAIFYGREPVSADIQERVQELTQRSSEFWKTMYPQKTSRSALYELLEVYACQEEWAKVVNIASRAVLHLDALDERIPFYLMWMFGLKEQYNFEDMVELGKHLLRVNKKDKNYMALAMMNFHFAGFRKTATLLFYKLLKVYKQDVLLKEAFGYYLSDEEDKKKRFKGIVLLKQLCESEESSYFTWRNFLNVLNENDFLGVAAEFYHKMHDRFPYAPEPYFVSSLIAMDEGDWSEGIRMLRQLLKDNPKNTEALLVLAKCHELAGEQDAADELLNQDEIAMGARTLFQNAS